MLSDSIHLYLHSISYNQLSIEIQGSEVSRAAIPADGYRGEQSTLRLRFVRVTVNCPNDQTLLYDRPVGGSVCIVTMISSKSVTA